MIQLLNDERLAMRDKFSQKFHKKHTSVGKTLGETTIIWER